MVNGLTAIALFAVSPPPEIALGGLPLGSLAEVTYEQQTEPLSPGDTMLFMTDGFPELLNEDREPLGYPRTRSLFQGTAAKQPAEIIAELTAAATDWSRGTPLDDDITFVVVKAK